MRRHHKSWTFAAAARTPITFPSLSIFASLIPSARRRRKKSAAVLLLEQALRSRSARSAPLSVSVIALDCCKPTFQWKRDDLSHDVRSAGTGIDVCADVPALDKASMQVRTANRIVMRMASCSLLWCA